MKRFLVMICWLLLCSVGLAQDLRAFADSVRIRYRIPELAYAVVSAGAVIDLQVAGVQRANSQYAASPDDRFHIGSNTKAITAYLAALLVQQGKISWKTKFLDLFPELKPRSRKAYLKITLQDLLTFRGKLPAYTYTFEQPTQREITGDAARQRLQLAAYFLARPPMKARNGLTPSNADYILAGLMLEKAAGQPFKELVNALGQTLGIRFGFDYPNMAGPLQPWGHDADGHPLPPSDNYKLDWLLTAGNLNVSLPDYIKFIRLQLRGLAAGANGLSSRQYKMLLFGLPGFSFGWFNSTGSKTAHPVAWNEGNAGAFMTRVEIIGAIDRAYIIFTNSATPETSEGIEILMNRLKKRWGQ